MIEIRITDPANTSADDLQRIAQFLLSYTSQPAAVKPGDVVGTIAPDDNPATGKVTQVTNSLGWTANFDGAGNFLGETPSASSTPHNSPEPDAATVGFGQAPMPPAGSVPNVPPVVASVATPPLPVVPGSVSLPDAVPTAPNVTGVNVDSDGLPWDARIHARTKEKNADRRWRRKRGVEDAVVSSVESELRQVLAIPSPNPNPMAQFKTAAELGMVVPSVPAVPVVPQVSTGVPAMTPLPVPTPVPMATTLAPAMTFATLLPKVTSAVGAQQLTHERVAAVLAAIGLPNLPTLAQRPDLVSVVHDQLFPPADA